MSICRNVSALQVTISQQVPIANYFNNLLPGLLVACSDVGTSISLKD